MFCELRFSHT
jgi:hypothetical protein